MTLELGLIRGTIKLIPFHVAWATCFEAVEKEIRLADEGHLLSQLHHIGSTSVPGLSAKPIIDVCGVHRDDATPRRLEKVLANLGWECRGSELIPNRTFFVKGNPSAYHLHLFPEHSVVWRNYLTFRDLLRSDSETCLAYQSFKMQLAKQHPSDRRGYQRKKSRFIIEALKAVDAPPPLGGWRDAP